MIEITSNPTDKDRAAVVNGLSKSNSICRMGKTDVWFFIREDTQLIGGAQLYLFENYGWLNILWIDKLYRNKGYGKKLLNRIEQSCHSSAKKHLLLDTFEFQNAKEFYIKCGYEVSDSHQIIEEQGERYFMKKRLK